MHAISLSVLYCNIILFDLSLIRVVKQREMFNKPFDSLSKTIIGWIEMGFQRSHNTFKIIQCKRVKE